MHFIVHSFNYYHGASYNATQNNKNHVKATKEQNDGWAVRRSQYTYTHDCVGCKSTVIHYDCGAIKK